MKNGSAGKADGPTCGCGGGNCCRGPGKWIWIVLALAVVGVLMARHAGRNKGSATEPETPAVAQTATSKPAAPEQPGPASPLPRLMDFGGASCTMCKMMAPILEDLKKTYAGKLEVVFIDVWENPDAGRQHGINLIPTQVFYDAQGKELFRHEGFFGKEDILAKWKELGVDLAGN